MSPRWDRTPPTPKSPAPETPGRAGSCLSCPLRVHCGPRWPQVLESPKASISLSSGCRVPWGGDSVLAMAQSQGMSKDRNRQGNQALALGGTLVVAWGHPNQSHLRAVRVHGGDRGHGDRDGDPAVALWWPRPPHPPPAPLAPGSWERLRVGTCQGSPGACPLPQPPPPRGTGTSHPRALGELGKHSGHWGHPVPIAPLGAPHLPDAGVPPGWAPAARQHLPAPAAPPAAPIPAAWTSPAAAVPARHRVTPSRSPLFSCLCFASPMVPGTQSRIVAPPAPRVMPASVPGPVPPPLTPLPPQGTAPSPRGGQGGHEPPPWGWCQIKPPSFR